MPTVKELKERLNTYNDEDTIAYALWVPMDAVGLAEQEGNIITEVEAEEAIEAMHDRHDCNFGMNWDVLSCHL